MLWFYRYLAFRTNHHTSFLDLITIHQIFFLARYWSKRIKWLNIFQLKLGNIRVIFPNFQNRPCCEKHLTDYEHNSLHLARKYARIFVLGHYICSSKLTVFLELGFRKTVRFSEEIMSADKYPSIFPSQMELFLCHRFNIIHLIYLHS